LAVPVAPDRVLAAETQELIDQLIAAMRAAGGAGLAATQLGVARRVCVIEVDHNPRYPYKPQIPLTVLVNPTITPLTGEQFRNNEGCLSVPGFRGDVQRYTNVRVEALGRDGEPLDFAVRGLSAGTYQHECDHLDGLLFTDRLDDPASLTTWDNFARYRQDDYLDRVAELVARYGS
jgi:peptide deformylase